MKVVIIGGGYAGVACALRLARRAGGQAQVMLINQSPDFIERIRLHQAASGGPTGRHPLRWLLGKAELVVGHAEAIDTDARTVTVDGRVIGWDRLVLAMGSRSGAAKVAGADTYAFDLRPDRIGPLRSQLAALATRGGRVAVVGGGLTGIETAAEIAARYPALEVTLLSRQRLLGDWTAAAGARLRQALAALDVRVRDDLAVRAVAAAALHTDRGRLPADLCIWTAGFEFPGLARQAGLACNARGQVLVDHSLRSLSHPEIYAIGDLAELPGGPDSGVPLGCKSALPLGVHAAENLAREMHLQLPQPFRFVQPFFCVSLGRKTGLVQFPDAHGRLLGPTLGGRLAAWFKELVCLSTYWALLLERRGIPAVVWKTTAAAGPAPIINETKES